MSNLNDTVQQLCLQKRRRYAPTNDIARRGDMLLQNLNVLVCEDEPLIAMDVAFQLTGAGATALIATTVADGLSLIKAHRFDVAVLDQRINGEDSTPIAQELDLQSVPYLIYSGFVSGDRNPRALAKPAASGELVQRLAAIVSKGA